MRFFALTAILTLGMVAISSLAQATRFGGILLHDSLGEAEKRAFESDLRYLYLSRIRQVDDKFLEVTGLSRGDGREMHLWLLRRISTIVGKDFDVDAATIDHPRGDRHRFPTSPLPAWYSGIEAAAAPAPATRMVFLMTNVTGPIYLEGKRDGMLRGLRLGERHVVWADSPRVGVVQVGEALFGVPYRANTLRLQARGKPHPRLF